MNKEELLEVLANPEIAVGAFKSGEKEEVGCWNVKDGQSIKMKGQVELAEVIPADMLQDKEVAAAVVVKNPLLVSRVPESLVQDKAWSMDVMDKASSDHRMNVAAERFCLKDSKGTFRNPLINDRDFALKACEFSPFFIKDSACKDDLMLFAKTMAVHGEEYGAGLGRLFSEEIQQDFKKAVYDITSGDETKKTEEIRKAVEMTCAAQLARSFEKDFGKPKVKSKGLEI